jgi:hypothetical protein
MWKRSWVDDNIETLMPSFDHDRIRREESSACRAQCSAHAERPYDYHAALLVRHAETRSFADLHHRVGRLHALAFRGAMEDDSSNSFHAWEVTRP